ncbi:HD domain-containing protein [Sulfurimonas sp. SAG-AH-194-L11]|nr:HD domain-containing phosphohydrolase [Sulfurimonas sp. SAG-AH-194-L11]MDF1876330.1 HD domain-containing protein [Sulfurimonas sp. SAG-AH-194-L11]
MHIQEVFNAMYHKHHYEYLVINKSMAVVEFSDKIIDYCEEELLKTRNILISVIVPELYGLEQEMQEVFEGKREVIEIPFIKKDAYFITLSVQAGRKHDDNSIETLVILFENVTEYVSMQEKSVQDRNDKELLVTELSKKNDLLEKYNKHMMKLVDEEVSLNNKLNKEIIDTQREIIATMGAIGETRSKETGAHVLRVAEYSHRLALLSGLNLEEADELKMASPMHDIGKVGIEDAILNKPSKLTDDEFLKMKEHAVIGYNMLKGSNQKLLNTAAIIAHAHHEKWDGSGYPKGLKKNEIHIYGRITAITDVFDALGHDRVYKKAWKLEEIIDYLLKERGKHFDPMLIDLFINNIDQFTSIQKKFA